ncbi:hypothetical protein YC2023_061477 [Brassica napus]
MVVVGVKHRSSIYGHVFSTSNLWLVVIERDGSGFTFSSRLDHIPTTPITTTMALLQ